MLLVVAVVGFPSIGFGQWMHCLRAAEKGRWEAQSDCTRPAPDEGKPNLAGIWHTSQDNSDQHIKYDKSVSAAGPLKSWVILPGFACNAGREPDHRVGDYPRTAFISAKRVLEGKFGQSARVLQSSCGPAIHFNRLEGLPGVADFRCPHGCPPGRLSARRSPPSVGRSS
jgi:hypothetical protein